MFKNDDDNNNDIIKNNKNNNNNLMMKQKPEKAKEKKMANVKEINTEMLTFDMDAVNVSDDRACRCWSCWKRGSRSANNQPFASKDKTMMVESTPLSLPLTNSTELPSTTRWRQQALRLQRRRKRYAILARSHQFSS